MIEALDIIGQGLIVGLLGKMVWQLGHLTGTVDGIISRLGSIEEWREKIQSIKL